MARKEKLNEDYFIKRVEMTGGETRKMKWLGRRGAPDRAAGWDRGIFVIVEIKEDDQPWGLQDHQAREIKRLRSWGLRVEVLNNVDEIDALIDELLA